jgi:hypothetical protein
MRSRQRRAATGFDRATSSGWFDRATSSGWFDRATSSPGFLLALVLLASSGCGDEPPPRDGPEPMRTPPQKGASARPEQPDKDPAAELGGEASEDQPGSRLPERPRADPAIERTLELIRASGLRFIDRPSEPEGRPSEYTAEQFAGMLRTKWDWIGYDLTELEPWLDAIATRSFKTLLAYEVVLADGTRQDLRAWLDVQLDRPAPSPPAEPSPAP